MPRGRKATVEVTASAPTLDEVPTVETLTKETEEPATEPEQSYEYVRENKILVCPACKKQAGSDLERNPVCMSTKFPNCPRVPV